MNVLIKQYPSSTDLIPIRCAAQALLEAAGASQLSKRTSSTEGHVAHILALIGSVDEARSVLDSAVRRVDWIDFGTPGQEAETQYGGHNH
jgi:hypothetical protein